MECSPGAHEACYSGPEGTEGVGICHGGERTCRPDGTWEACGGEQAPAVEDCNVPGDEDCNVGVGCSETMWARLYGLQGDQTPVETAVDSAGNIYVVGSFDGLLDIGDPPLEHDGFANGFVAKLDPSGGPIWSVSFESTDYQYFYAVAVTPSDEVVVGGVFMGSMTVGEEVLVSAGDFDAVVMKLTADGVPVWARRFGDAQYQHVYDLAVDGAGDIVVSGNVIGSAELDGLSFGVPADEIGGFVLKLSPEGQGVWARTFEHGTGSEPHVFVTASGEIALSAGYDGTPDFGDGPLPEGPGLVLARLDQDGQTTFVRTVKASGATAGVVIAANGDLVVAADLYSDVDFGGGVQSVTSVDVFVVRYSAQGAFQWQRRLGGLGNDVAGHVRLDARDRPVLAFVSNDEVDFGLGPLPSAGGHDLLVTQLDTDGSVVWGRRIGGTGPEGAPSIVPLAQGGLIMTGRIEGSVDFGTAVLSGPAKGIAVAKFAP